MLSKCTVKCHLTAPGSKFQSSWLKNKISLQPRSSGDLCVWWRQARLSGTNQFQPQSFHSKARGVFLEHLPKSDMFDSFSSPLLQVLHTPFAWCWSLSPGEKSKGQLLQFVRNTSYLSELHQSQHGAGECVHVCVFARKRERKKKSAYTYNRVLHRWSTRLQNVLATRCLQGWSHKCWGWKCMKSIGLLFTNTHNK